VWNVLPKFGIFKIILTLFSILLLAIIVYFTGQNSTDTTPWENFTATLEFATPVAVIFILLTWSTGKWLWMPFWRLPLIGTVLNKNLCPDLNGTWKGSVTSNFKDEEKNDTKKEVRMDIKADFFGFRVSLISADNYQNSKVVLSEITKDPRTGTFYLSYIFEGNVPFPLESDDRVYDGAGKLEVKFDDNIIRLKGMYWTNRAWQRGNNTAGIIELSRLA